MEQIKNMEKDKTLESVEKKVARALLEIGAVGFRPEDPIQFKSGIWSPVYVDNRLFTSNPNEWKDVIEGFQNLIKEKALSFDMIAGIESAGISHSAVLGYQEKKPMVYVKKEVKGHGTKKRIEGGKVEGKKVLLLEDLVSTGGSSISGVNVLREEGASVDNCVVIVSYGFKEAVEKFDKEKVNLHTLTSFPVILEEALAMGKISAQEAEIVQDWFSDPHGWAGRHGFNK